MKLTRGLIRAADFENVEWINSTPISLSDLSGRVALVFFWDYTCVNCLHALSYLKVWHGRYADKGLSIIGIHAPEFDFGAVRENVARAVEDLGIPFPVAMDNAFTTWEDYACRFWPAWYLVDSAGFQCDYFFGEGGYAETETGIQALLREDNPRIVLPKIFDPPRPRPDRSRPCRPVTPEIFLGYRRGRIGNPEGFDPGRVVRYPPPAALVKDVFYAEGDFFNDRDCLVHVGSDLGRIHVSYEASEVNIVAEPDPATGVSEFEVAVDGRAPGAHMAGESLRSGPDAAILRIEHPRLFQVVREEASERHRLTLTTRSSGVKLYCITFVGNSD